MSIDLRLFCCYDFIWNDTEKVKSENFYFVFSCFSLILSVCLIGLASYFVSIFCTVECVCGETKEKYVLLDVLICVGFRIFIFIHFVVFLVCFRSVQLLVLRWMLSTSLLCEIHFYV